MAVRVSNRRNRAVLGLVAAGMIGLAGWLLYRHFHRPDERIGEKAFYTTDDGDHSFVASIDLVPPFRHDGKEAVRVWYYTCDDGKTRFVGYLEKFTDDAKAELDKVKGNVKARRQAMIEHLGTGGHLVKRKGEVWVAFNEPEYQEIVNPTCPDGGTENLRRVVPGE